MSIRPVDLQLMVQKSSDSSRMNQQENARPEVAHQQFAEKIQKESEQNSQQVVQTHKSEKQSVDKDGRGSGRQEQKRKNRNDDRKPEKKTEKAKGNSIFDVSI